MRATAYIGVGLLLFGLGLGPAVSAAETDPAEPEKGNAGKLQIDLTDPQLQDEADKHTLTVLEQLGITLFVPESDQKVSENKAREEEHLAAAKARIFLNSAGEINNSVAAARTGLFRVAPAITGAGDYQTKKVAYQDRDLPTDIFIGFLLFLAGALVVFSGGLTWRNVRKNLSKEASANG